MSKVLFIAEIGGNHKGDFHLAKKIVSDCIKSNVDVIKLQLYSANGLVNSKYDPNRHSHFKNFELTQQQYITLAKMIKNSGKLFCASVWDLNMLDWISPYVDIWKIGSGDFTSLPIISDVLRKNKLTILSTGLCSDDEIKKVVNYCIEKHQRKKILLMQCTSMYPIPDNEANLAVIENYKKNYDIKIGYSDHTLGIDALKVSISMGVDAVEFHYTLNRADTSFRDNLVSLNSLDVNELALWREKNYILKGTHNKKPTESEISNGHVDSFRRGVYVNRKIKKGEKVNFNDLILLRPYVPGGLSPIDLDKDISFIAEKDYDYLDIV